MFCLSFMFVLTLSFTFLTAQAVQFQSAPGKCCFKFYTRKIPLQRVFNITKTHSACQNQAFMRAPSWETSHDQSIDLFHSRHFDLFHSYITLLLRTQDFCKLISNA
uniref:Chemokine interleukin-8-like domain-containing protein n=1 Tax=Sander lucioperca TaxID=283035 RepID=A0A8C9XDV4_SANLU